MASWQVTVDFGSGAQDITDDVENLRRQQIMHSDLRPAVNTVTFEVTDLTVANQFITATDDMDLVVNKDGSAWFTGKVRPNFQSTMLAALDRLNVEGVCPLFDLQKNIDTNLEWEAYDVCDTASTGASIVHQLLVSAGFALGDMSLTDINTAISWYVVEREEEKTYWQELSDILYEYGYVLDTNESGVFIMRELHPTSLSTSPMDDLDMVQPLQITKNRQRWEAARITWYPIETFSDVIVFSDRTDGDQENPMNVALANTEYYPPGSGASQAVYSMYRYADAEILNVQNERTLWSKTGAITKNTESFGSKRADIRFLGGSGGGTLTKFEIRGDAIVRDKTKIKRSVVYRVANSDRILKYTARFIEAVADGDQLASDLANYYDFADFMYSFEVDPDFTIAVGDEFALTSTAQNLTTNIRVVQLTEDTHGVRMAVCEGLSAYSLLTTEVQDVVGANPETTPNQGTDPLTPVAPVDENLFAWWPADELIESTLPDHGPSAYDGTIGGSPTEVAGVAGDAIKFDANTENVNLLTDAQADLVMAAEFSVSIWFKSASAAGDSAARIITRDDTEFWALTLDQSAASGSQVLALTIAGDKDTVVSDIETDKWYHVVINFLEGDAEVYVNRILKYVHPLGYSDFNVATRPLALAVNTEDTLQTTNPFDGCIDEIRIYSALLSQANVSYLFASPGGVAPTADPSTGTSYRIHFNRKEIRGEELVDGSWVKRWQLGSLDSDSRLWRGLRAELFGHLDAPNVSYPVFDPRLRIFDWENDEEDQWGIDIWTASGSAAVSSAASKFGTYSLRLNSAHSSFSSSTGAIWEPQSVDAVYSTWFRVDSVAAGTEELGGFGSGAGTGERIRVQRDGTSIQVVVTKGTGGGANTVTVVSSHAAISADTWYYLGVVWDESADTVYLIVDDTVDSDTNATAWSDTQTPFMFVGGGAATTGYFDDTAFFVDDLETHAGTELRDWLLDYYAAELPWNQDTWTEDDVLITTKADKRIVHANSRSGVPVAGAIEYVAELANDLTTPFSSASYSDGTWYVIDLVELNGYRIGARWVELVVSITVPSSLSAVQEGQFRVRMPFSSLDASGMILHTYKGDGAGYTQRFPVRFPMDMDGHISFRQDNGDANAYTIGFYEPLWIGF